MPNYSNRSQEKLKTCHKDLQIVFNVVVRYFDNTIVCGERGREAQNKAVSDGFSKVKYPNSKHNKTPSMAVDSIPYPIDWKDVNRMRYYAGFVVGIASYLYETGVIKHRVRWGGDWDKDTQVNDQRFNDLPHFELY
jgi:peptidoglycan L-alanyl-D-glutamate endopeptidase CwlK